MIEWKIKISTIDLHVYCESFAVLLILWLPLVHNWELGASSTIGVVVIKSLEFISVSDRFEHSDEPVGFRYFEVATLIVISDPFNMGTRPWKLGVLTSLIEILSINIIFLKLLQKLKFQVLYELFNFNFYSIICLCLMS